MLSNKSHSIEHLKAPEDTYYFIYFIIFFLGLSGHLPWNAILTAQPYFNVRLENSSIGSEFTAHFAIIFKALKLAVFVAVSVLGVKMNNKLWVGASAIGNVIVFAIFSVMVQAKDSIKISANSFYLITLALVVAAGSFLAIFECGMYSILGTFPSYLTQSFMAGNAIGGILAALNLIISYYSSSSDIYSSTKTYFITSTVVFIVSVISFITFLCTDYCKYYQKRLALYTVISQVTLRTDDEPTDNNNKTFSVSRKFEESRSDSLELLKKPEVGEKQPKMFSDSIELIKKLWAPNLALFMVGFVNLTIFPALVSVTESTGSNKPDASAFQRDLFVPMAFLVVSIADFLGKMLLTLDWVKKYQNIPFNTLSLLRFMLIPLMLLGNIRIKGKSLIFPSILASDTIFFSIILVAFISGSFIGTFIMVTEPKKLDITLQSRATVLLCSAGLVGVFGGSVFSLCLKLILRLFTT